MMLTDSNIRWYAAVGLVLLSLIFHSFNLGHASYDLDEAVHIWHAQKPYSEVVDQSANDPNPPVYNLIISAWVKAFGVSEWTVRFFSVLMGVLGVVLMFVIASRNFGLAVGIMAALLYCFSPIQFRFTHLARPYSMLMVTVLLSYGMLLECLKSPSKWKLFAYYLATTLMIYVHPTSVFNLPAQGLIVILFKNKELRAIFKLAVPMVLAVLTFGIWMVAIPYFERDDTMWFGPPTWFDLAYVIRVFYGHSGIALIQLGVLAVLLLQFFRNKVEVQGSLMLMLILWVLVPFLTSVAFSHLIKPVFQDKYILSVQPAMLLLLAVSIHSLKGNFLKWTASAGVFLLLFSAMNTKPKPEGDWRSAVDHIRPMHDENSMVFIDPWYEFRTFAFYFDRHAFEVPDSTVKLLADKRVVTTWHDVVDPESGRPNTKVVHMVLAHQGFVNPQADAEVLERSAKLIGTQEFLGISIRTYEFNPVLELVDSIRLDFSEMKGGEALVASENEFSPTIVAPLKDIATDRTLWITTSVALYSEDELEGVVFVTSVERDGAAPVVYSPLTVSEMKQGSSGRFEVVNRFELQDSGLTGQSRSICGTPKAARSAWMT